MNGELEAVSKRVSLSEQSPVHRVERTDTTARDKRQEAEERRAQEVLGKQAE